MAETLTPPMTVKVRFVRNYSTKEAEPQTFREGQIYEVSVESARHFVVRRVADYVETLPVKPQNPAIDSEMDSDDKPKRGRPRKLDL